MKKKIILIIVAVIIIIAALLGILYLTTDLFKTPEQLFYKHFAQNSNLLGNMSYTQVLEESKKKQNSSYTASGEITLQLETNDAAQKEVEEALAKSKINYQIKNVGAEQKVQADLAFRYDNQDILAINLLKSKEQYGIKVADAYDKYISVENNNLKGMFTKLGLDATDVPDKIEILDMYDFLNVDKNTLKQISDRYMKVLQENIPSECYQVEKNVTILVENKEVSANAYQLVLSEEQTKNVLIALLQSLKEDEMTLNLVVEKYNKVAEVYGSQTVSKDDLVKEVEDTLSELKDLTATSEGSLKIITYTTKEELVRFEVSINNNVKMTVDMSKQDKDKVVDMMMIAEEDIIEMKVNFSDTNMITKLIINSDGEKMEMTMTENVQKSNDVKADDFTADNSVKLNDMTSQELNALVQTISNNVMKILPQKMQLLGISGV